MEHAEFQTTLEKKEEHQNNAGVSSLRFGRIFFLLAGLGMLILGSVLYRLTLPPSAFVPRTLVTIPSGYSLTQISNLLKERAVIRSQAVFSYLVMHENKEKGIAAGDYLFNEAESVWVVAQRLSNGEHGIETHRITFPEGITSFEMADIVARVLPDFNSSEFLKETAGKEGYLFPDTYTFFSTATSGPIVKKMEETFALKTKTLHEESDASGRVWEEVINLASLIEKEAATAKDRRIVAGILEQRIATGMRLQVDAPFMYSIGKASLQLSSLDLESDSPYNTYRHEGLPPTPIGNPGIDAISAVIHPEVTSYLYYLSDKNGTMYYAETFAEHKLNKAKYLR